MSSNIKIYTYNLLSSTLSSPSYHIHCQPKDCDPNHRWVEIEKRLLKQIQEKAIICLQEISNFWLSKLLLLFSENKYVCIYDLYNCNLGCCIAYQPTSGYKLNSFEVVKIGELLKRLCCLQPEAHLLTRSWDYCSRWIKNKIPIFQKEKPIKDSWGDAIKKQNTLILLELETSNHQQFVVGTYHMPCAFYDQDLMCIHAAMVLKTIQEYATGSDGIKPYLLAGDFNLKPNDITHKMITEGGDFNDQVQKSPIYLTPNIFNITHKLTSLYEFQNGKEPNFTCVSYTKDMKERFIDCIDYIFASSVTTETSIKQKEEVLETKEYVPPKLPIKLETVNFKKQFRIIDLLPTYPDTAEISFPTATEPSDHIPLGANLELL